ALCVSPWGTALVTGVVRPPPVRFRGQSVPARGSGMAVRLRKLIRGGTAEGGRMSETIAGVVIPDSALAAEATELVRDAAPPLLYDHSRRVYLFGTLQGRRLGLTADPEL